ncbi:MAG: beta-propeller domain-containing protein [Clostridia bacterium]|nr:beta-propeller domain-containing protein [Clostridia bacterium]
MFKDKYISDNEKIVPDESLKRYIKSKMNESTRKEVRHNRFSAVVAVALSLCVVLSVVLVSGGTANKPQLASGVVTAVQSYDDLYNSIYKLYKENQPTLWDYTYSLFSDLRGGGVKGDAAAPESSVDVDLNMSPTEPTDDSATGTVTDGGAGDNSHSETNNQVQGVDEADIVKNDGKYIYSAANGRIRITLANEGNPQLVSTILAAESYEHLHNIFIYEDKLVALLNGSYEGSVTKVKIYNTADKANPKEVTVLSQSGGYNNSRLVGDTLYLLSDYYVHAGNISKDKPEQYVPCTQDGLLATDDISCIGEVKTPSYLVVSAIDVSAADITCTRAILGGAENVYCDTDNLYFTSTKYGNDATETTDIVKLGLSKEEIKVIADGTVPGTPLNQFSMDEYKGNLRIVTTTHKKSQRNQYVWTSETSNGLYVLDEKMEVIGKIDDLARDERVYSVRFTGDIGYFVTFRETDPLFTVDLSDPTAPKILSELKIPGFSEYLHPFGEGLLFGFGKAATATGSTTGLKLSMFNVADPTNVTESHNLPLDADYSEASYNHKAIMVDKDKNIIAFAANDYISYKSRVLVYGYSETEGFTLRREIVIDNKIIDNMRFLWIGEYFYTVGENEILTFNINDFTPVSELNF